MTAVILPVRPRPNSMVVELLDMGFIQRGSSSVRVNRPGARYRIQFMFPIMDVDDARAFISKMQRAKRTSLQIDIPLLIKQGIPGTPVVDGAVVSAASTISIRGLTPGYVIKEQYWFTVVEADGSAYLHTVVESVTADATGEATVEIEPPLRAPFADGDTVHFAVPYMQGFMDGDAFSWTVRTDRYVELAVTVEEFK